MKLSYIFLFFCALLDAQTNLQKERAYLHFESQSKSKSPLLSKPKWVDKETYLKEASFYPIYQIFYNIKNNTQEWKIDPDMYLVVYNDDISYFFNPSRVSSNSKQYEKFFGQNKFVNRLTELYKTSFDFKIGYLTEEFYPPFNTNPNLLIVENNQLTDKEHTHKDLNSTVLSHYSSLENYQEKKEKDIIRKNLTHEEVTQAIKSYFRSIEYYCSKDTTLVFTKFIEHINIGTKGLSKKQKNQIRKEISNKFSSVKPILHPNVKRDAGDFSIYNVDFSPFFKEVLNKKQLANYNEYMDIHFPKYFNEQYGRNIYGETILYNARLVKGLYDHNSQLPNFKQFIDNQLTDCGCKIEKK